jgi:hypothetical protein
MKTAKRFSDHFRKWSDRPPGLTGPLASYGMLGRSDPAATEPNHTVDSRGIIALRRYALRRENGQRPPAHVLVAIVGKQPKPEASAVGLAPALQLSIVTKMQRQAAFFSRPQYLQAARYISAEGIRRSTIWPRW